MKLDQKGLKLKLDQNRFPIFSINLQKHTRMLKLWLLNNTNAVIWCKGVP